MAGRRGEFTAARRRVGLLGTNCQFGRRALLASGLVALTGCGARPADGHGSPTTTSQPTDVDSPVVTGSAATAGARARAIAGVPSALTRQWPAPVRVARLSACLVASGLPGAAGDPHALADAGAAAMARASRLWGPVPGAQLVLVAPPTRAAFAAATGTVAATAVTLAPGPDVDAPTTVVRPDIIRGDADVLASVLTHECVHVLADRAAALDTHGRTTHDLAPAWVREGMAEYISARALGLTDALRATARDAVAAHVPARLALYAFPTADELTAADPRTRARAYDEAWLAIDLLVGQVGLARATRWHRAWSTPTAPYRAGHAPTGRYAVDLAGLRRRWSEQLRHWRH